MDGRAKEGRKEEAKDRRKKILGFLLFFPINRKMAKLENTRRSLLALTSTDIIVVYFFSTIITFLKVKFSVCKIFTLPVFILR